VKAVRDYLKAADDPAPRIAPYLADVDLSVRLEATKALVEIGGPKTVEPLLKATEDNDAEIQIRSAEGLVNVYQPGYIKSGISGTIQRAGDAVRARFGGSNDQIIDTYVVVPAEVISALARLVRGGASWESRAAAARGLGVLRGRAGIPDLLEALRAKDDQLMFEALNAIEKIGDPSAGPGIEFRLRDLDDRIQTAALETTGTLRNRAAAPQVADVFDHARNQKIKRVAATTLAELARPEDRAYFVVWLNDRDDLIRAAGAEGLGRLKQPQDRPALEMALKGEHILAPRIAEVYAVISLGNLDMAELSPFSYLIDSLNAKASRVYGQPYLIELARDLAVRRTIYAYIPKASKDVKMSLSYILGVSGDKDSIPVLEMLSMDPDAQVAQEGIRGLRSLRARLG
jgi:HEAT repeat protein